MKLLGHPKMIFSKTHYNKLSKSKDKEIILKVTREKISLIQENPNKAMSGFLSRNLAGQERVEWYIQSAERKKTTNKECFTWQSVFQKWRQDKDFPKQTKRELITTRSALWEMLKGIL